MIGLDKELRNPAHGGLEDSGKTSWRNGTWIGPYMTKHWISAL